MKICNYEIKTIPVNPIRVCNADFPINKSSFKIKGDFTFRIYYSIQFYLWKENRIPEIEEISGRFNVSHEEVEKNIESLHEQDALIFYTKKE